LVKNNHLLEAENIRFSVPERRRRILDIPRIAIPAGKIVFALGANGAGKSTLLHFLAGRLFIPDAQLTLKGKNLPPLSEKLLPGYRGIELIRQEPDINPHFRVDEELDRHLRVFDPGTSARKKQQYIKKFRLKSLLNQKTGSISGGERRRLALACALAGSPEIILLDEPFSDLDSEGRNLLSYLILEMASEGIAFLIVSHNGSDAHWLADEIWTLDSGRLIERLRRKPEGFIPLRSKTAALLGFRNLLPLSYFPELAAQPFRTVALQENQITAFAEGMLDLGMATCQRIRKGNCGWHFMWKTTGGILFSKELPGIILEEGTTLRLGTRLQDVFLLK
jgi:iron(III) transport system ATP-binding protein